MSIEIMSHEQATRSQAAEHYVLCELTAEEREAFEGHYFDCPACFERVKLEMQFLRQAREVLDREPEKGWLARMLGDLRRPVPAFASAMLLCAVGMGAYQQVEIADLKAPFIEPRSIMLTGPTKGSGSGKRVNASRKERLNLKVEFNRKPEFTSYVAEIRSPSGRVEASLPVPEDKDVATVVVPVAGRLDAGSNSIVVYGVAADGGRTPAGRGEFDLQFVN